MELIEKYHDKIMDKKYGMLLSRHWLNLRAIYSVKKLHSFEMGTLLIRMAPVFVTNRLSLGLIPMPFFSS